jgi:hypothetical protein
MFGGYLWRFLHWLGSWNFYIAFGTLAIGVWSGILWRLSPVGERWRFAVAQRAQRFCRACRWATPDSGYLSSRDETAGWSFARCMHPSSRDKPARYLVLGEDRPSDMAYCETARKQGRCGPHGRFWEPGPQLIEPQRAKSLEAPQ